MKTIVGAALLTLTSLAALPAQGGEPTYILTDLGAAPEGTSGVPSMTLKMGINDHGDVAASRVLNPTTLMNAEALFCIVTAASRWSTRL
jgi:hypothetical protein